MFFETVAVFTTLHFPQTYKWAQKDRLLHFSRLERGAKVKRSSLLDPFVSSEEDKLL